MVLVLLGEVFCLVLHASTGQDGGWNSLSCSAFFAVNSLSATSL